LAERALVVKLGGELLEESDRLAIAVAALKTIAAAGPLVVVHGGGKEIDAALKAAGIEKRQVDGLRVTDDATLEVVVAVLAGAVNTRFVAALNIAGVPAVGLTGADASCGLAATAPPHHAVDGRVVDLGRVGVPGAQDGAAGADQPGVIFSEVNPRVAARIAALAMHDGWFSHRIWAVRGGAPPRTRLLRSLSGFDGLRRVDVDPLRLGLFRLRQRHAEDAVVVVGPDVGAVDSRWEREGAHEAALPSFASIASDRAALNSALACDHELSIDGFGGEVVELAAGDVELDHDLLVVLPDVDRRQEPAIPPGSSPEPEHPLEAIGHGVKLGKQRVTSGHAGVHGQGPPFR